MEKINKISDEELEIVNTYTPEPQVNRIVVTKSQLLTNKAKIEDLLKKFDK